MSEWWGEPLLKVADDEEWWWDSWPWTEPPPEEANIPDRSCIELGAQGLFVFWPQATSHFSCDPLLAEPDPGRVLRNWVPVAVPRENLPLST